jgi:hypothetical protein
MPNLFGTMQAKPLKEQLLGYHIGEKYLGKEFAFGENRQHIGLSLYKLY